MILQDKQLKIANEIINDAFWLGYILELKKKISDYTKKEILNSFLIFFSSIFAEEIIKAKCGALSGKRKITLKDIENYRNYNLKYCPVIDSNITKNVINDMGIDFRNYIFDIVLYLNDNNLLDINFRDWDNNKESNFELIDGIVATPLKWVEALIPAELYSQIKVALKDINDKKLEGINKVNIKRKSYSSFKLFVNSRINSNDKLYILQRYGLIKNALFVEKILKEDIWFDIGNLHFDSKVFMTKVKAIIIEMIWNDQKNNKGITLFEKISIENKGIDSKFYSINRKCRNNLHYSDYHYISKSEKIILDENQNLYLSNVLKIFDDNIFYKFDMKYKIGLALAKIEYWSRT